MPLTPRIRLEPARPQWLTVGTVRLAVLCGVIVVIAMLPGRLSPGEAGVVALAGLLGLAASLGLALALRRPAGLLASLRHVGLVALGAAFFLFWTFVYLALWWVHPDEAFRGLAEAPRFADFFYYAVSTAFISPPGDIFANSRGARSATLIEMMTGFALVAAYLSSFVDWRRQ